MAPGVTDHVLTSRRLRGELSGSGGRFVITRLTSSRSEEAAIGKLDPKAVEDGQKLVPPLLSAAVSTGSGSGPTGLGNPRLDLDPIGPSGADVTGSFPGVGLAHR